MLACALVRAGRMAEARVILEDLLERTQRGYVPPCSIAKIHNALGNLDETFLWFARSCDVRDVRMTFLNRDHEWDALRSNPRFVAIGASNHPAAGAERVRDSAPPSFSALVGVLVQHAESDTSVLRRILRIA